MARRDCWLLWASYGVSDGNKGHTNECRDYKRAWSEVIMLFGVARCGHVSREWEGQEGEMGVNGKSIY